MSIREKILKTIRYMMTVMFGLIGVLSVCTLKAEASGATEPVFGTDGGQKSVIEVTDDSVIPYGVYINETHVGGMTIGEAKAWLAAKEAEISLSVFTLTYGDHVMEIPFTELGLTFQNTTDVLYDAATIGQTGTLIDRYKELKDLENDRVLCTWSYSFDEALLEEKTAAFADVVNVEAVNATINRKDHQWFRTPHVNGLEMDTEATLERVRAAVEGWQGQSVSAEAVVEVTVPKYTDELLNTITEIIGSYVTVMDGNVEEGRGKNVVRGAELIHGTILLPGESFSAHAALTPFELSNGYDYANAYSAGGYVNSIGGGVCQLTSTLYNAIMEAELQVDRRYNHSMIVSYAPYGFDSTVNDDGSKDLVFTNPYDFPIYIEARAWSESETFGQVYFAIWGTLTDEIREREIELYTKEIEREDAEMNFVIDPSLEPGEKEVLQLAYPKLVIEAYKRVIVNGEVVSDEYLYTDHYRRSDGTTLHNPVEESTEESTAPDESMPDESESGSTEETAGESTEENTEVTMEESTEAATGESDSAEVTTSEDESNSTEAASHGNDSGAEVTSGERKGESGGDTLVEG